MIEGVYQGGKLGRTLDLLAVRKRFYPKSKIERWIFDIGLHKGHYLDSPPLVHIALDRSRETLTLDMKKVKIEDEGKIVRGLLNSQFVSSAKVFKSPAGYELTIEVKLKKPIQLNAFFMTPKKNSRLVLDLSKM
ncbi:MAG: hypothetical protein KDD50_06085 [Bdellovibrionales bacterium]|nr:hypothetical protein [Bdellovibrionales bacterium]